MRLSRLFLSFNIPVLAFFPLFSACSSHSHVDDLSAEQVQELVRDAHDDTAALNSAHLRIDALGNTDKSRFVYAYGDLIEKPSAKAQGRIKGKVSGMLMETDFKVINNIIYAKPTGNTWIAMGKATDVYDISATLDPERGLAKIISEIQDPHGEGSENVDEVNTEKIVGKVSGEYLKFIDAHADGDYDVVIWVERKNPHHLVRAMVYTKDNMQYQLDLSNWNVPVNISLPHVNKPASSVAKKMPLHE